MRYVVVQLEGQFTISILPVLQIGVTIKKLRSKTLPDLNLVMVHSVHPELMLEKYPELCPGWGESPLSCHLGCLFSF